MCYDKMHSAKSQEIGFKIYETFYISFLSTETFRQNSPNRCCTKVTDWYEIPTIDLLELLKLESSSISLHLKMASLWEGSKLKTFKKSGLIERLIQGRSQDLS